MKLSIISVVVTTKTSKAGKPYQNAEVVYKNLENGKVMNKNITQYSKEVFDTLTEASPGQMFDVDNKKDDNGYYQWTSLTRLHGEVAVPTSGNVPTAAPASTPVSKGTWETPEERALKQVYIIKQSSLTAALKMAELNKEKPTVPGIIQLAQELTDWVLGKAPKPDVFTLDNDLEVE